MKSLFHVSLRIALAVIIGLMVLIYFGQERLIFPGTKLSEYHKFRFKTDFVEKTVIVEGVAISSLLFQAKAPRGLMLYFHGNGGNLDSWGLDAEELVEKTGFNVWMLDYPGYGKSGGDVSSEGQLVRIAQTFLAGARELPESKQNLIVYGRSIGTGLAIRLASEKDVSALILESPYLSMAHLAHVKFPWAPLFLLKYPLHSDEWIVQVKCPVLIVHGDNDEVIPFDEGKSLAELYPPAKFSPIFGGHHNDLANYARYWQALGDFLAELPHSKS